LTGRIDGQDRRGGLTPPRPVPRLDQKACVTAGVPALAKPREHAVRLPSRDPIEGECCCVRGAQRCRADPARRERSRLREILRRDSGFLRGETAGLSQGTPTTTTTSYRCCRHLSVTCLARIGQMRHWGARARICWLLASFAPLGASCPLRALCARGQVPGRSRRARARTNLRPSRSGTRRCAARSRARPGRGGGSSMSLHPCSLPTSRDPDRCLSPTVAFDGRPTQSLALTCLPARRSGGHEHIDASAAAGAHVHEQTRALPGSEAVRRAEGPAGRRSSPQRVT
jgi:hypothetical protein